MGDLAPFAAFPHHSWIGYWEHVRAAEPRVVIQRRQIAHSVVYLARGTVQYRWVCRGIDRRYHVTPGTIRFDPATGHVNTFVGEHNPAHSFYTLLIPMAHLRGIARSEGIDDPTMPRHLVVADDAELLWCMARLSSGGDAGAEHATRQDEAARQLVLRLHRLCGRKDPEWQMDASPFDRVTLHNLRDFIDAHLRLTPSSSDMAVRVGLSPSHFAKKFRQSTGLSLQRFVNRRRVVASIPLLQAGADTLTGIAHDLGFSSQSHFTRLFGEMTGMTPAKYRKQFRRTAGWRAAHVPRHWPEPCGAPRPPR
jgi:AraC-like DNA-binding protein